MNHDDYNPNRRLSHASGADDRVGGKHKWQSVTRLNMNCSNGVVELKATVLLSEVKDAAGRATRKFLSVVVQAVLPLATGIGIVQVHHLDLLPPQMPHPVEIKQ